MDKRINEVYQRLLESPSHTKHHIFLDSFKWWKQSLKSWKKRKVIIEKDSFPTTTIPSEKECAYYPSTTISQEKLQTMYENVLEAKDFDKARKILAELYDYNLPSTIPNVDHVHAQVLIMGAGPVGLYTSLLLGKSALVIDNRIYAEGIRRPYTRLTQFGFYLHFLEDFIPGIKNWSKRERHFDFINVLENLLYLIAYHRGIPMYFTKRFEAFDSCIRFANTHRIQYIFDCTGGRLRDMRSIEPLDWSHLCMKEGIQEIRQSADTGYFHTFIRGKQYKHTTLVIKLLDSRKREIPIGNLFGHPHHKQDIALVEQLTGTCFSIEDFKSIANTFKGKSLQYMLPTLLYYSGVKAEEVHYIVVQSFQTTAHHAPRSADVVDGILYVGMGNTLGVSEFGIHFGLRSAMKFSRDVVSLLQRGTIA